ncbi:sodium-dependent transporter [Glycomyces buryatensis]|uniref:Sodium-dependent transporter n=1 Tax=Glycomyces buryatensis TaxID=2570927 RepID=A0A4S8Q591_9ACTN|nr:sodium-dependent transporter [Glycomyces buryatensis]THV39457.1 sodium-dependent transporter [Glycomyces buryatensis]
MKTRETWGTRAGFIMAAAGSAIGLGNIWRFPGEAYEFGGGAFLVPYLIAILTAGIPLLLLEYTIGRRYRSGPPSAFRMLSPRAEGIGWWQNAIAFFLATFYAVIIAWAVCYVFFAVTRSWGEDSAMFFGVDFLAASEDPLTFGEYRPTIMAALIGVWVLVLVIMLGGVRKGVELANRICIPLLVVLFGVIVIRAVTLDGALDGLNAFFTPQWDTITALETGPEIWLAAYGQVFFSLSIGMGTMIAYSSYLKKKAELSTTAVTVAFANSSFELMAGIGVFSILGFMSAQSGTAIGELVGVGGGVAFVTFPAILNEMPGGNFVGVLFFASLVVAGVSSIISMVIVPFSSVEDRFGWSRKKTVAVIGIPMALFSILIYPTTNGSSMVDAVDFAVSGYGLVLGGLATIVLAFATGKIRVLAAEANRTSVLKLGWVWYVCLALTTIMLTLVLILNVKGQIEDLSDPEIANELIYINWGVGGAMILFGLVMTAVMYRRPLPVANSEDGESVDSGSATA